MRLSLTALQAGNLSLSDEKQLVFTTNEQRILYTFNCRDFLELAKHWHVAGRAHIGTILSKEFALSELVRRFRHLVIHHGDQDLTNKVLWLAAHAYRPSRYPTSGISFPSPPISDNRMIRGGIRCKNLEMAFQTVSGN